MSTSVTTRVGGFRLLRFSEWAGPRLKKNCSWHLEMLKSHDSGFELSKCEKKSRWFPGSRSR